MEHPIYITYPAVKYFPSHLSSTLFEWQCQNMLTSGLGVSELSPLGISEVREMGEGQRRRNTEKVTVGRKPTKKKKSGQKRARGLGNKQDIL